MSELSAAARDLLPKSEDEFGTVAYWDAFYEKRGDAVFHWYVDGDRGAALVEAALGEGAGERLVVNLGCGTCEVPQALAAQWRGPQRLRVLSVDTSEACVEKSRVAQRGSDLVALDFAVTDALTLPHVADASVDVVFDKGLIDALHPRDDERSRSRMTTLFATLRRVLRPGGRVVVVSMVQGHVRALLERECAQDWSINAAPAIVDRAALVPVCLLLEAFAPIKDRDVTRALRSQLEALAGAAPAEQEHALAQLADATAALRFPTLAAGDDALIAGDRVPAWAKLWAAVDERIAALKPETRVRVVELNFGLRGSRNGVAAAGEVAARLRKVAGVRWAREPAPRPLAFGVHAVVGAAAVGEHDDADAVRDLLGEALGCEAVDDDAASTSSESDAEDAPLRVAWPEVVSLRSGQVR
jgi:SAM-dependent methyltransferase